LPENPLLPHAKLRELHKLMVHTRELERKQRSTLGAREAVFAATAVQLQPGDLLCGTAGDATMEALAPAGKTKKMSGYVVPPLEFRLGAAAALACGLRSAGTDGLVLAYAAAGASEPGWQQALSWAHREQIPLILACVDATGGKAPRGVHSAKAPLLTWTAMVRFAKNLRLPILAVDGEDAVAVYRVMQESAIRARYGGGPAVLWAVTAPPGAGLTRSQQPLARLERYLAVRKIKLPRR
jgi:pyruvate dehydrogenase E1 component alpha subunit